MVESLQIEMILLYVDNMNEIFDLMNGIKVIDSHEHLVRREDLRSADTTILKDYLHHYISNDIVSSGMNLQVANELLLNEKDVLKALKTLMPYLDIIKYTGYGRLLSKTLQSLYGVNEFTLENIEFLNKTYLDTLVDGRYKYILKDVCNIEYCVLDIFNNDKGCDTDFFLQAFHIDEFILPPNLNFMKVKEDEYDMKVTSFSSYLELLNVCFSNICKENPNAIFKCTLAYFRNIEFKNTSYKKAEEEFNEVFSYFLKRGEYGSRLSDTKYNLQNYLIHYIHDILANYHVTMQFHTGLQAGNSYIISDSNPLLLNNLLLKYPSINFDLLHIGYPYDKLIVPLAKNLPNVYLNMAWTHIISPNACTEALCEYLDSVPLNKIIAFGGDFMVVDMVVGHLQIAKENVALTLSNKIKDRQYTIKDCDYIIKKIFYENAKNLYKY